jgi:general secretion pathway protein G
MSDLPSAAGVDLRPQPEKSRTLLWIFLALAGLVVIGVVAATITVVVLVAARYPQISRASEEARQANLQTSLQTVRSQLLLYKTQHNETYPTDLARQLTLFTDIDGHASPVPTRTHLFGPYLQTVPANPFTSSTAVRVVSGAQAEFDPPFRGAGWWFNSTTGELRADLPDCLVGPGGDKLNAL